MRELVPPSPEEISAYVDGELTPVRQTEISYCLSMDPRLAADVAGQRTIRDGLRSLRPEHDPEALPAGVKAALARVRERPRSISERRHRLPWLVAAGGALAAGLLLIFVLPQSWERPASSWISADTMHFLGRGSAAYEFGPQNKTTLEETLPGFEAAARMTAAIQSAGFVLKGGREVALEGAGAILLIYQDTSGEPLGLMIWPSTVRPGRVASNLPLGVATLTWTDGPFSFALTGRQDPAVLQSFRQSFRAY